MKLFRQNLDTINRLLAELADDPDRAIKAYSLGMISMFAERDGATAPDVLLEAAASCTSLEEAADLYEECEALRDSAQSGHAASCPDGGAT